MNDDAPDGLPSPAVGTSAAVSRMPRVCVLLATHNAAQWLEQQLTSIFAQQGVAASVIASDDGSTDGTRAMLSDWTDRERLVTLPATVQRFGNANRNFLRLITEADVDDAEYVALSDHDDIWYPWKLERAVACLRTRKLDAYSSDVTAFWPDGRERLLRKSGPMRLYDYLFESAGPGCTFVLRRRVFDELRAWLLQRLDQVRSAKVHDWLIYAYARSHGWRWHIDARSTMRYRQHGGNEQGANVGWQALRARWQSIVNGDYRRDILMIAALVEDHSWVTRALQRLRPWDRLRLIASVRQMRRASKDQLALAMFLALMPRLPV